jgi:hypothetical protein
MKSAEVDERKFTRKTHTLYCKVDYTKQHTTLHYSLLVLDTLSPAALKAAAVACLCAESNFAGTAMTALLTCLCPRKSDVTFNRYFNTYIILQHNKRIIRVQ